MPDLDSEKLATVPDQGSVAGSSATGVGVGTIIVALAHLAPSTWRETITLAAPALTLAVTGATLWAKSRLRQVRYEKSKSVAEAKMRAALEEMLDDPNLNDEEKDRARKLYAATKLQRFNCVSRQAEAPSDTLDHEGVERSRRNASDEDDQGVGQRA